MAATCPPPTFNQRISVELEYPIYFTRDVFETANSTLAEALKRKEATRKHRVLLLVDRGVVDTRPAAWTRKAENYFDRHGLALVDRIVLRGGEAVKNDAAAPQALLAKMHALGLDRHSFVVIVGGGAVLDMAGYVAAVVHRGVRAVRVPTTVLGQADSGMGVKNGVNAFGKKNFVGTFTAPFAVINDSAFLETLGRRDTIAGLAEAIKVALIRDRGFFEWIRAHAPVLSACESSSVQWVVRRSAELHLSHIRTSGDPFELGSARPLDYGHWAAHKLEAMTHHRLRHGEAVSIGIAIDALYSGERGICDAAVADAALDCLASIGLPIWDDALDEIGSDGMPRVLDGIEEFREHLGGDLTLTMLAAVGEGREVHEADRSRMAASIAKLRARAERRGAA
jgi:3-dehydroquinate synthase